MSTHALNWAWGVDDLAMSTKFVLVRLADYAGARGESWPTQAKIAHDTCQSVDTVQRALRRLAKLGLVYKTHRYRDDGGRRANLYILMFTDEARDFAREEGYDESIAQVDNDDDEAVDSGDGAPEGVVENGAVAAYPPGTVPGGIPQALRHIYKEEPSIDPSNPLTPKGGMGAPSAFSSGAQPLSGFEAFAAVWPFDAVDLAEPARRVFQRLDEAERVLAVKWARAYLDAAAARGTKRMSGANWLRGKGWAAFKARPETASPPQVFIREGSPQWAQWERHHAALGDVRMPFGKLLALDLKGRGRGRMEPSEWPPGRQAGQQERAS